MLSIVLGGKSKIVNCAFVLVVDNLYAGEVEKIKHSELRRIKRCTVKAGEERAKMVHNKNNE